MPQRVGECDSSEISEIAVQQAASLTSGKLQIEPSIVFVDETFTVTYRTIGGEGPWGVENTGIPEWLGFLIDNESGPHDLFDDGTNGDAVAGDGVYSRSCLHLREDFLAHGQVAREYMGMGILDTSLRGGQMVGSTSALRSAPPATMHGTSPGMSSTSWPCRLGTQSGGPATFASTTLWGTSA